MKKPYTQLIACLCLLSVSTANAAITKTTGWLESAAIEWEPVDGVADYHVYIKPAGGSYEKLDKELVRQYPGYFRADALGLKAGTYQMKVVPVNAQDQEVTASAIESGNITVTAHSRTGLAHYTRIAAGKNNLGAYNNDGTLMSNAKVIYVWADNAKTVSMDVKTASSKSTTYTGLQSIINGYQKGYEDTPLDIRIIGTIKATDMDEFKSTAEGLQIKGNNGYSNMPITIEGVGEDAAVFGFGFLLRNCSGVELRNFAIMLCMDDAISFDTQNSECWIHNMDLFYGNTGGDADQAKGDGTVDIKGKSKNITISFNHFWDNGKSSLGGMKSESTDCWMTYHHNWFDHSDSRHPRIRTAFYHVFNNYFDGNAKYGVGMTMGGSSLVESNVFRNCKYPMLISKQGTDATGDGTFSGEAGGVIKAYNNTITGAKSLLYYNGTQTDGNWDAVLAKSRDEEVTVKCLSGETGYNNEADETARKAVADADIEDVSTVKETVKKYAGRMNGGDFVWKFLNSAQDENYAVITELKTALQEYKSTLVGFSDGTVISNGGSTTTTAIKGGDGQNISDEKNDEYVPSYGGGGGSSTTPQLDGAYVLGTADDYFWFNADNETAVKAYMADTGKDGIKLTPTSGSFDKTRTIAGSDGTSYSDHTGSMKLNSNGGYLDIYYSEGIASVAFYLSGSGTQTWEITASKDGNTWDAVTKVSVSAKKGEHPSAIIYGTADKTTKYVRITNNASGSRDVQGIKIATFTDDTTGINNVKTAKASAKSTCKYIKNGTVYITDGNKTVALNGARVK